MFETIRQVVLDRKRLQKDYTMTKNAFIYVCWIAVVVWINACTSPLEQLPEKVRVTANPTINLPLGDPLKGSNNNLGESLRNALTIDADTLGLDGLYDYVDPTDRETQKFLMYRSLVETEIAVTEYNTALTMNSKQIEGLPTKVSFASQLPPLPLPFSLPEPLDIPLNGEIRLEQENIQQVWGNASGLSLTCSGSKTIPEYITVTSKALNLDVRKEKHEITFGRAMTFTGGEFELVASDQGIITIDIAITMGFKDIVDTKDITIKPEIIFNWSKVELNLANEITSQGSYPDSDAEALTISGLKESLLNGKLRFDSIPLYLYVDGPALWFADGNITLSLDVESLKDGEQTMKSLEKDTAIARSGMPEITNPYKPKQDLTAQPASFESDGLTEVFNAYPEALRFKYKIDIKQFIVTPDMLRGGNIAFKTAIAMVIPLALTAGQDIDLAEDLAEFDMPNFGDKDMFGRSNAGASGDAFDFMESISVDITLNNALGLDGMIQLYANLEQQEAKQPLAILGMTGSASRIQLTREDLKDPANFPFSPVFDFIIPRDTKLAIKRTLLDNNPFSIALKIRVKGNIHQEFDL
jgi:hypothetical protein